MNRAQEGSLFMKQFVKKGNINPKKQLFKVMKRSILFAILLTVLNSFGQQYTPVKGRMMTTWGERVTPDNAWREYPRPQLKRDKWQNLNGLWEYAIVPKKAGEPQKFDGNILVPFAVESSLSGVGKPVLPEQKVWYKRSFSVPAGWNGQNVLLHFEAVDWETAVWMNGKFVGIHKGGSTAFSFDITPYLKKGEQELVVSVWDPTDQGTQARGKQVLDPRGIWYTPVTGIWKTVWLEPVGKTAIRSVYPVSDIDKGQLALYPEVSGTKGGEEIRIRVLKNNSLVAEKNYSLSGQMILNIPSPQLWSPDCPELYQLELTLYRNDKVLDKVGSYFAMRKVSIVKDDQGFERIQLNNKTIFQYGTLDQGWWPDGLLTPPSAEGMRYDMEILKKMGFNMLRKHIKVEPALYYYYADSLGLLIWQDMPSGFETEKRSEQHIAWDAAKDWNRPVESAGQFEAELKTMIDQLRFFPSIVTWVVFNEGWGQYDTKRVVDWTMAYDPTRIIDGVSGWTDRNCGHMIDVHQYPGPGMEPAVQNPGRVVVLGEFGGLGLPVKDHLWNPGMRNWGYRTYTSEPELLTEYAKLIHNLSPMRYKGLSAAVYTQTTDVEGEVNGLLTYDRKVIKMNTDLLRILHAPLYSKDPVKVENIISDSEVKKRTIRFSEGIPGEGWQNGTYEDRFKKAEAAITVLKGKSIASVSSFILDKIPDGISLRILAYGNVKVWLNGKLVLDKRIISKRHYEDFNISEFKGYLKKGENKLAIETGEFEMEAEFDFGLYSY